jgi:DNA end-binding protein Ku
MAPRTVWKGAISFGLVHIPVALYAASRESGIDFDWIDRRSHDPVGYKRVNKRTGKEIESKDVVRGVKQEDGDYVILSDEEIKAAYPKSTQSIDIEAFVKAQDIPFFYLERPYALTPLAKGEKVYALLRESMTELGMIGIARVVMHAKEHLCALVPNGDALMLNTLRWSEEMKPLEELEFPSGSRSALGLKPAEIAMARQLIEGMTGPWEPEQYSDRFAEAIQALVEERVESGDTTQVRKMEEDDTGTPSNVVDLTELLKRSLSRPAEGKASGKSSKAGAKAAEDGTIKRKAAPKTAQRKAS